MNDFTASNGYIVRLEDEERLVIDWPSERDARIAAISKSQVEALREFFRAEEDASLGRWRWPEDPDYVVYAPRPGFSTQDGCDLFVVNELWGSALSYVDAEFASYDEEDQAFAAAGRAYFDAHPEPKPWHDAKPGEVWEITQANQEPALYVVENTEQRFLHVERRLLALSIEDPNIIAGRRIWPEATS